MGGLSTPLRGETSPDAPELTCHHVVNWGVEGRAFPDRERLVGLTGFQPLRRVR